MKGLLGQLGKLVQIVCTAVVLLLLLLAMWLVPSGKLSRERLRAAYAGLQGKKAETPPSESPKTDEEWRRIEETRLRSETAHRRREEELRRMQDLTAVESARLDEERRRIDAARSESDKLRAALKKERDSLESKKIDQATEANLPIFEQIEGQDLAALMFGWDDKEIVRYLRLLSPEKSAEVLGAMQAEGSAWRTPDKDAPKGTPTRFERIVRLMQQ